MKTTLNEGPPERVPAGDSLDGDIRGRWPWVERAVWTERMLEALEKGPKNGVWHSLIDKVYAPRTLWAAWEKVAANAGAAGFRARICAREFWFPARPRMSGCD